MAQKQLTHEEETAISQQMRLSIMRENLRNQVHFNSLTASNVSDCLGFLKDAFDKLESDNRMLVQSFGEIRRQVVTEDLPNPEGGSVFPSAACATSSAPQVPQNSPQSPRSTATEPGTPPPPSLLNTPPPPLDLSNESCSTPQQHVSTTIEIIE